MYVYCIVYVIFPLSFLSVLLTLTHSLSLTFFLSFLYLSLSLFHTYTHATHTITQTHTHQTLFQCLAIYLPPLVMSISIALSWTKPKIGREFSPLKKERGKNRKCVCERERQRETERETEINRQRQGQSERDRRIQWRYNGRGRETEREIATQRNDTERHANNQGDIMATGITTPEG